MSDSTIIYQTLLVPGLLVFRVLKSIVVTPLRLLLFAVLLPFRIAYAFFGSLWWLSPFSKRYQSDPPTIFDFILASVLIGLVTGLVLYLTSRILFALPPLVGFDFMGSSDVIGAAPLHAPPRKRRIRRQGDRTKSANETESTASNAKISGYSRGPERESTQRQHDYTPRVSPDLVREGAADWESRWAQVQKDSTVISSVSPSTALPPLNGREGIGVAAQVIVEESSDDQDTEYF